MSTIRMRCATAADRAVVYGLRHEVYAREIHQHAENAAQSLSDALDRENEYIVAIVDEAIAGFVSITPPRAGAYSLDKYLRREEIPFALDGATYEIRILTALPAHRGTFVPLLLMYAALRWVEAHRGTRVVAIGRREVRPLYEKVGLRACGREFVSGAVAFQLMTATVTGIRAALTNLESVLERMEASAQWDLPVPFRRPAECFHGGAFFDAIGDEFDHLERSRTIINADVLDAWFPPSPRVLAALHEHLPWLARTSPPTGADGLIRTIARVRGVDPRAILPGAGSSALIFLALREWLTPSSRVLLPEPTYGEYAHVLEQVIRCRVDRLVLRRDEQYALDLGRLAAAARNGYDLIVLVNPNSPTGRHVPRADLESFLRTVPATTLVWIDETYVDYAGADQSIERFATTRPNVIVCKSMSKVYALSGLRTAYLCTSPHLLERLRAITPPWAVGLPAQVAAVAALQDDRYYAARHRDTHILREELATMLLVDAIPSVANFILFHLPGDGPPASEIVAHCREHDLFLRDAATMGSSLGTHAIRVAVKDRQTNARIAAILNAVRTEAAPPVFCPA